MLSATAPKRPSRRLSAAPSPALSVPPNPPPSRLLLPTVRPPVPSQDPAQEWLGLSNLHFTIDVPHLQVRGYQMYAVEPWILQRSRKETVLVVYTGDLSHTITVTALRPSPSLSPSDLKAEWDKALQYLHHEGARPKQTSEGVLMATSLAHFPSDKTIVHIPSGDFLSVREQLYTNINLLRIGCSGRAALSLEEPSDATKDRFISIFGLPEFTHTPIASYDQLPLPPPLNKSRSHSYSSSYHGSTSRLSFSTSPSKLLNSPSGSLSRVKSGGAVPKSPPGIGIGFPTVISPDPNFHSKDNDKHRFRGKTKDRTTFNATVLELVKLIQSGLFLFGMNPAYVDGLLCEHTVKAIRKWIVEVGDPCVGLEPMERIADPMFVAALFSLILSVRNKLSALSTSQMIPRDPLLQPQAFFNVLASYVPTSSASPSTSLQIQHHLATAFPSAHFAGHSFPSLTLAPSSSLATSNSNTCPLTLSRELVMAIQGSYVAKVRAAEGRTGMRRVLRGRIEETDGDGDGARRGTLSSPEGGQEPTGAQILSGFGNLASGFGLGGSSAQGALGVLEPTCELDAFIKAVIGKEYKTRGRGKGKGKERRGDGGDGIGYSHGREKEKDAGVLISVKELWTGGVANLIALRKREMERLNASASSDGKRERDRRNLGVVSDGDVEDGAGKPEKVDGRSTEEESDTVVNSGFGGMWGERVQKKLESWAGLTRKRGHASLDLTGSPYLRDIAEKSPTPTEKSTTNEILPISHTPTHPQPPSVLPAIFVGSADGEIEDDDLLSSGQVSPVENLRPSPFHLLQEGPSAESSSLNTGGLNTDYERNLNEFNRKRPWSKRLFQSRISSWSDPLSARDTLAREEDKEVGSDAADKKAKRTGTKSRLVNMITGADEEEERTVESPESLEEPSDVETDGLTKTAMLSGPHRRRSFHDVTSLQNMHVQPLERMKLDVELCGQMLIMNRREQHLKNVLACLRVLIALISKKNTLLREDYNTHARALEDIELCAKIISDIDMQNAKADKTSQATHSLRYESEQFRVQDLWHTATPPRQKVFSLREKVFGAGGRRIPAGKHGAHGRFNRLQWTLDGEERLVDHMGRTESEAEEENKVDPHALLAAFQPEEEEDVVEHPSIKPMWLLRFFTSWGARWGATSGPNAAEDGTKKGTETSKSDGKGNVVDLNEADKTSDLTPSR